MQNFSRRHISEVFESRLDLWRK